MTTEAELIACTVGVLLGRRESCHQLSSSRKSGLLLCDELWQEKIQLIRYRSGCFLLWRNWYKGLSAS